jgi:GNAT superfamily N-acetyltransferase
MRAREFVTEAKTVDYEGLTLKVSKNDHELMVDALDDWGNNVLGHVTFYIGDDRELDPQDLWVNEKYQGQGIARVMYDYVKKLGYKIVRSWDQTDAGAGFWDKHRGQDVRVWEQGVAEGKITLSTDPNWYGATVDNYQASGPVVNIPANQLVGFEPDDKMNQPKSKVNVEKIVAGLKQGAKLPPLLVRKYKNGYQVLDGHHRFWAYKLLSVKSIPAQIVPDSDIEEISKQGVAEEQLDELSFLGSECTKDCSGHRAGYDWSKRKGLRQANSWSPSFNKGAGLAVAGK